MIEAPRSCSSLRDAPRSERVQVLVRKHGCCQGRRCCAPGTPPTTPSPHHRGHIPKVQLTSPLTVLSLPQFVVDGSHLLSQRSTASQFLLDALACHSGGTGADAAEVLTELGQTQAAVLTRQVQRQVARPVVAPVGTPGSCSGRPPAFPG